MNNLKVLILLSKLPEQSKGSERRRIYPCQRKDKSVYPYQPRLFLPSRRSVGRLDTTLDSSKPSMKHTPGHPNVLFHESLYPSTQTFFIYYTLQLSPQQRPQQYMQCDKLYTAPPVLMLERVNLHFLTLNAGNSLNRH